MKTAKVKARCFCLGQAVWAVLLTATLLAAGCRDSAADPNKSSSQLTNKQENHTEGLSSAFLIIDMDGDGPEFIPLPNSKAIFDVNEDGMGERTAWVHPDDAILLVYDHNIDSGPEKLTKVSDRVVAFAINDAQLIRSFDRDRNGHILLSFSPNEDNFPASFLVFQDENSNGYMEYEERNKFRDLAFGAVQTPREDTKRETFENVGEVRYLGTIEREGKSSLNYYEVQFIYDGDNTVDWTKYLIQKFGVR